MWRNYLVVGLRALAKNKTYAFINIFGLALGLAACLMLLLYVRHELSYDKWLPETERAYQLQSYYTYPDSGKEMFAQLSAYAAKTALIKDFPQIEKAVYTTSNSPVALRNGEATAIEDMLLVDGPIFDILQFPFVEGDRSTALSQPGSLVLTEREAERLLGAKSALGQTLTLVQQGKTTDYRVTGIVKNPPKNSHVDFSMVGRFEPSTYFAESPGFLESWGALIGYTYVQLKPGADPGSINSQLKAWEKRNIPPAEEGESGLNEGDYADYGLVNIADVHLGKAQIGAMRRGNDMGTVLTFASVAALILGMACVNFINLATAKASQRAREVALRKVLGANRRQLVVQFLGESILIAALAAVLALAAVELALPSISGFLNADLKLAYFGGNGVLLPTLGLVLLVGTVGGIYPALFLSRFQPASVLRANKSAPDAQGSGTLRNILVVGQFAVSIGLIICTAIIYSQTLFARTVDPGFNVEGILQIENIGRKQVEPLVETLRREVGAIEQVKGITHASIGIASGDSATTAIEVPGVKEPVSIGTYTVDSNYFDVMGIQLLAGRSFSEAQAMDDATRPSGDDPEAERAFDARGRNIVINQHAAKLMGFRDPQKAVGKQVKDGSVPMTIIGVVKDARLRSVRDALEPMLFTFVRQGDVMIVRYEAAQPAKVRERIEAVWKRIVPEMPFEAEFSEELIANLYKGEDKRGQTFAAFALLAAVIASLGLFGLASFTAERRTKEIGVRKVFGARARDIVRLLAWQFSKPVIVANLFAWPVAWWVMRDWLNTFDARIALTPGPFLLAGFLALVIAIGTIAGHAINVARTNPIHALRYE